MSLESFSMARQETRDFLVANNISHHMYHGPVTLEYWKSKQKILIINCESYGYQDCRHVEVDYDMVLGWMFNENKKTKTVRNSVSMINVLIDCITRGVKASELSFKSAYRDIDSLKNGLKGIAYYNVRAESNDEVKLNADRVSCSGRGSMASVVGKEIMSLSPDYTFISGRSGCHALNEMLSLSPPLKYLSYHCCPVRSPEMTTVYRLHDQPEAFFI